jgi:hypothetical protein
VYVCDLAKYDKHLHFVTYGLSQVCALSPC